MRALLDAGRVCMAGARNPAWLGAQSSKLARFASCRVRLIPHPAAPADAVAERLAEVCASPDHVFWPEDVSLLAPGLIDWDRVLGHRQVTDAYLLALAVRNRGRLVTFDRRISPDAVTGAGAEHLAILS